MTIYQKPKDDLALVISAAAGKVILSSHFNVMGVRTTPVGESLRNTKIAIEMTPASAYTGRKTFYFDRLNLADVGKLMAFPTNGGTRLRIGRGLNAHSLLTNIRDALGISVDETDIEDTTSVAFPGGVSLLLKAKPNSLGWIGQYTLKFKDIPDISEAFYQTSLPGY